jgi:Ca-activated chloride channel family protein
LIGYENRRLRREDFANDRVDAGDIGAGHTVTALYELSLQGSGGNRLEPLRYQEQKDAKGPQDELGYLKLRYKLPGADESKLLNQPLPTSLIRRQLPQASDDLRWAAAVAGFGQLLRGGRYLEGFSYQEVLELARGARGRDPDGHRGGFLSLVSLARALEQAR